MGVFIFEENMPVAASKIGRRRLFLLKKMWTVAREVVAD